MAEFTWLLVAQQDHSAACARDLILKLLRDPLHTSLLQLEEILTLIDLLSSEVLGPGRRHQLNRFLLGANGSALSMRYL